MAMNFNASHAGEYSLNGGVDWIAFGLGDVVVPSTTGQSVKLRSVDMTQIKFTSDTYQSIDITKAESLTTAEGICSLIPGQDMLGLLSFDIRGTNQITNLNSGWLYCENMTHFNIEDTSKVVSMEDTWLGCISLTSFPLIDTSSVTNMRWTWTNCSGLTSFPPIDTSSVTNMFSAWMGCSSLTSFPVIDTSSATDMDGVWDGCTSLVCIGGVDTSNATTYTIFNDTPALTTPNSTDQALIEAGTNWVNPGTCP